MGACQKNKPSWKGFEKNDCPGPQGGRERESQGLGSSRGRAPENSLRPSEFVKKAGAQFGVLGNIFLLGFLGIETLKLVHQRPKDHPKTAQGEIKTDFHPFFAGGQNTGKGGKWHNGFKSCRLHPLWAKDKIATARGGRHNPFPHRGRFSLRRDGNANGRLQIKYENEGHGKKGARESENIVRRKAVRNARFHLSQSFPQTPIGRGGFSPNLA